MVETDTIDNEISSQIPKSNYTTEQIQAGYENLAKSYGFFHTLLYMEAKTPYKRHELIKWTVNEFYHNFVYLARAAKVEMNYHEIMEKKNSTKK